MDIDPKTVDALRDCVAELRGVKDELRSARAPNAVQHIVVTNESKSDTSRAVHTAVTSAIVAAVLSIITLIGGIILYVDMKDHVDAIYMMAPALQHQLTDKDHPHASP